MRFAYAPTNVPEWIHLFNEVALVNGYPDARDSFHPTRDLKYCIESLFCLYQTLQVLNEYKINMSIKVITKTVTTSQEYFDGYELDQTGFAEQYLIPLEQRATEFDILPQSLVMELRQTIKEAMTQMVEAVPILIGKELHLTTLEENAEKHCPKE